MIYNIIKTPDIKRFVLCMCLMFMLFPGCFDYMGGIKDDLDYKAPRIVFVNAANTTGTEDGSKDYPYNTIQEGIDAVFTRYIKGEVRVAAGTYTITSAITMREGISIFGGYNASDWNDRNNTDRTNALYRTQISGSATAISCSNIINLTVIDGFAINAGNVGIDTRGIILTNSSPVVSNNTINGGSGTNSHGIYNDDHSSPSITKNTIEGGSGTNSYGIYNRSNSSPVITNNDIKGGSNGQSFGIYNEYSSPAISTNTISGGSGSDTRGIHNFNNASPSISNNTINGGNSTGYSYGISNETNCSPIISNNTINGSTSSSNSLGIYNETNCSPVISNNSINGGTASFTAFGIRNVDSPVIISNNTIFSGTSSNLSFTYAIYNNNSSSEINNNTINGGSSNGSSNGIYIIGASSNIKNNIIFTTATGGDRYGIREADASSDPQSVRNNNIFSCATALYLDENSTNIANLTTVISTGEGTQTLAYWGNISEGSTAMFVDFDGADDNSTTMADNDWHLRSDAPLNVRGGGLDLSASFTTDKDGVLRTTSTPTGMTNTGATGWSIGAFERD